jgi:hypothetical protein
VLNPGASGASQQCALSAIKRDDGTNLADFVRQDGAGPPMSRGSEPNKDVYLSMRPPGFRGFMLSRTVMHNSRVPRANRSEGEKSFSRV